MNSKAPMLLIVLAVAPGFQKDGMRKPVALRALEEGRKSTISGRIEWSVLPGGKEDDRLSYVSRFAKNGDTIFENRGDTHGWTVFDARERGISKYPILHMSNGEGYWYHLETALSARLWKRDGQPNPWAEEIKDIRAVGVSPFTSSIRSDVGLNGIWRGIQRTELLSWEENQQDGIYVVRAHLGTGAQIIWRIDPQRGWNTERIAYVARDGQVLREVVCSLKRYGETWLPETTTYMKGGEVTEVILIDSARLNQPDDPGTFSGADLGLEPGTNLALQNERVEVGKPPVWNGQSISTWDQWLEDTEAGKRQWGRTFQRINRGEPFKSRYDIDQDRLDREVATKELGIESTLAQYQRLWLEYVRGFIKRYQLNEEQSQKAMRILTSCQERADQILARRRPQLTALVVQLEEARRRPDNEQVRRLAEQLNQLRKPIDRIFEARLKPGLEKLPTRAQRQAAEQKPTSKPAGRGGGG
ncbi:MAG TPA: hypothetical protein VM487_16550 [Phycisphaerae bacterium]|nr:hypothetical protein [Phycisphaerae bacterium]